MPEKISPTGEAALYWISASVYCPCAEVAFNIASENPFEGGGTVYVSSLSPVSLAPKDRSSNMFALAGVASTYYLLDEDPTLACLGTAYNSAAAPGSCPNPIYGWPFQPGEGAHSVYYYAVTKIGNLGAGRSSRLSVDSTPPESSLKLNGQPISGGATVYAAATDLITLVSTDPVSNGVANGLTTTGQQRPYIPSATVSIINKP